MKKGFNMFLLVVGVAGILGMIAFLGIFFYAVSQVVRWFTMMSF